MKKRGSTTSIFLIVGVVIAAFAGLAVYLLKGKTTAVTSQPLTSKVFQGEFVWKVLDSGKIESSKSISIDCQLDSEEWDGSPLSEVMAEGTVVKPGDIVAKFDSTKIQKQLQTQEIMVNSAEANVAEKQSSLDAAVEEKEEYFSTEGTYVRDQLKAKTELIQAKKDHQTANEYVVHSRKMFAKGYITANQLEQDRQSVDQHAAKVRVAEIELALLKRTRKRKTIEFESKIKAAEISLSNAKENHKLEIQQYERIQKRLKNCEVVVPAKVHGQIVYPNRWDPFNDRQFVLKPGAKIREKQPIVLIPNPKHMQVKASVNEANIVNIKKGLDVDIKLDAIRGLELKGVVERVGQFAEKDNRFGGGGVNKYSVIVKIIDPPNNIRSGMNASVNFIIERKQETRQIALQAIYEQDDIHFCFVKKGDRWERRQIKIGSNNDKHAVVLDGLEADEEVALNPGGYRDLLDFPKESKESKPSQDSKNSKDSKTSGENVDKADTAESSEGVEKGSTSKDEADDEEPGDGIEDEDLELMGDDDFDFENDDDIDAIECD